MAEQFGIVFGEKQLTTGFEKLVDGLTVSRFVWIKPLTTNPGNIIVRSKGGAGPGTGMLLEPTEPPITLDTRWDNSNIEVRGSVAGCTVTYIGTEQGKA